MPSQSPFPIPEWFGYLRLILGFLVYLWLLFLLPG
jgi:hypothetical protein